MDGQVGLKYYKPNLDEFVPKDEFPYSDWSYNPITEINHRDFSTKKLKSRIQAGLNLHLIEGLDLSSKIQYEIYKTNTENYTDEKSFAARQFVNETSGWGFSGPVTQNVPKGGVLQKNETTINAYNFRNQVKFDRTFKNKHIVSFLGGAELSQKVTKFTKNPDAFGYDDETLSVAELLNPIESSETWAGSALSTTALGYPFNVSPTHDYTEDTERFFSLFGNLSYTYDKRYTISGSYRTDASNLITDDPKFRYNPFWSIGGSWNMHNEKFMSSTDWVDRLTLKTTYGYNGNIDRSTSFLPLIDLDSKLDRYTQEHTAFLGSYGNPTLRWEKTGTFNFEIDFSFFNNKLNGSIDFYNKESDDLIVNQSIPAVNGTTNQKINSGKMQNKGIEVSLGTELPLKGDEVTWTGRINYAYNDNKITEFTKSHYESNELYDGPTTSYVEGHDANAMWAYKYTGLKNVGTKDNPKLKPSVQGMNGDKHDLLGWVSGDAPEYMLDQGTTRAPTTLSMINSFQVYDFNLSFIITAKLGHVFRRQSFNYPAVSGGNSSVNSKYSKVIDADPEDIVPIPEKESRYYFYDRFYPYMDYLTEDASHIRFQEINLTYSIPDHIINKIGLNKLNVFAQANNIGTILFNHYGEDPEYPKGDLKLRKSFTFGLNFEF